MLKDYAYRTVEATIKNSTGGKLTLTKVFMPWGRWISTERPGDDQLANAPAILRTIEDTKEITVVVETAIYLSGCEATLTFDIEKDPGFTWNVYWDNPYCGRNTYRQFRAPKDPQNPVASPIPDLDPECKDLHENLAKVRFEANGPVATPGASDKAGDPPTVNNGSASPSAGKLPVLSLPEKDRIILWCFGSFPDPYKNTDEVTLLASPDQNLKHWTPTNTDFKELAKFEIDAWNKKYPGKAPAAVELTNLQSLVAAIKLQSDKTIARINIVTHATGNLIALSGTVDRNDGACGLYKWKDYSTTLDPFNHEEDVEPARSEVLNGSRGLYDVPFGSKGWFNVPELGKPTRDAIRRKLADGAEIHLYACHTANSGTFNDMLMNGIANTFNCYVFGFESAVYYDPKRDSTKITDRRITGVGKDEADAIAHEDKGLVHNDARPQLKKYSPSQPMP